MFHSRAILALTLISLSWTSVTARAATLNTTMSVGATYDLAGNTQSSSSFINDGTPHIYRVDIFGQVSGLATNESFGAELYNLTLSGSSLSRNTVSAPGADLQTPKPNYVANNPALVNIADGATFAPIPNYYSGGQNADLGTPTTDLQGILAAIDNTNIGNTVNATTHAPVTDPRQSIGVGAPFWLGSVYLQWLGNANAALLLQHDEFSAVNSQTHQLGTVTSLPDVALNFVPVPEPAGICLFLIGAAMIGLKRRTRSSSRADRVS
jgi:hypothetical protein